MPSNDCRADVAVVGGGIAGLSAAWELIRNGRCNVTIFDAADDLGGKLTSSEVAGLELDDGAESLIAARPEALGLAADVGLRPSIVHPAVREAAVLSRGDLRPLPPGLITGVPADLRALAASRILSIPGLLRIPLDDVRGDLRVDGDISVGELLRDRLGAEVVDRLAEPLLAGVYASDPYDLSLQMANPSLFRQLQREKSLLGAARSVRAGSASTAGARRGPVFAGIRGGVARLAGKTAETIRAQGGMVRTATPVDQIRRDRGRWQVVAGTSTFHFDAVVVAVPAPQAAQMVRTVAPFTAVQLRSVEYANVALVTLAYPAEQARQLRGTGFLIPPVEGYAVKGVTYVTEKWEWAARAAKTQSTRGLAIVRASVGRFHDDAVLQLDDDELADVARQELHEIVGLPPASVDTRVTRWPQALPQYRVGHADLVDKARAALSDAPGLALAGAAYDGVGVASCVGSGQAAAREIRYHLQQQRTEAHG